MVGILSFLGTAWIFKIEPAVVMWRWVGEKVRKDAAG